MNCLKLSNDNFESTRVENYTFRNEPFFRKIKKSEKKKKDINIIGYSVQRT